MTIKSKVTLELNADVVAAYAVLAQQTNQTTEELLASTIDQCLDQIAATHLMNKEQFIQLCFGAVSAVHQKTLL